MYITLWGANHSTDSVISPPQCYILYQLVWYEHFHISVVRGLAYHLDLMNLAT